MYKLTEILPAASRERLLLRLISDGGEAVTVNISCKVFSELSLKKGDLDDATAEKLLLAETYEKAVLKGLSILGYGQNSAKRMRAKLMEKGFSRETAEKATEYLLEKGYIDEKSDAIRLCESMIKKKYGKKRILSAICAKGYGDGAFAAATEFLSEVDFVPICAEVIKSKFKDAPKDRTELQKAIAKLVALGYNVGEIKAAIGRI